MSVPPLPAELTDLPALVAWHRGIPAAHHVRFPGVPGVDPLVLARLLYRGWLDGQPRWRPFVHLSPDTVSSNALEAGVAVGAGGWVYVAGRDAERIIRIERAVERVGARLLGVAGETTLPAEVVRRVLALDAYHREATDPGLASARTALEAHARAAGTVVLKGAAGGGVARLAHLVHAQLDGRPACVVRPGRADALVPGRWQIYEDVDELSSAELDPLVRELAAEADFGRAAPIVDGGAGERPAGVAFAAIRGRSGAIAAVLQRVARFAPTPLPMLVRGPTGTGKELVARAIHDASGRAGRYVALDASALGDTTVESLLFGHVRGAFTGADRDRAGAFREAHGGTLFLDELGNLPPATQAKLLRALQARAVQPLGSDRVIPVDVRVVAATNADLEDMVRRGEFREDLLFRFNVAATVWLPPLRERPDDILDLAQGFATELAGSAPGRRWLTHEAAQALQTWRWPGNVRELRHVVEAAVVLAGEGPVGVEHLGYVAPSERRPVPRFLTTTAADPFADGRVPRAYRRALTALTLPIPSLTDRGALSVRNAVLCGLDGRPITPDALDLLSGRPWWGDLSELEGVLRVLARGPAPIDRVAVAWVLPDLAGGAALAPILALIHPTRDEDGRLDGPRQSFVQGAVVIGRSGGLGEGLGRERAEALRALTGDARPGRMVFDHLPSLSRAHVVIVREAGGLLAHLVPGARLPTYAGEVGAPRLHRLGEGAPVDLGSAGVVEVCSSAGGTLLRVYLFAGEVALAEAAALVPVDAGPQPTRVAGDESVQRVWSLNAGERAALTQVVSRAMDRRGSFARWVREGAAEMAASPELAMLARYLASANPGQSCVRLYQFEGNAALRAELVALVRGAPDPGAAWAALPTGLRTHVPDDPSSPA